MNGLSDVHLIDGRFILSDRQERNASANQAAAAATNNSALAADIGDPVQPSSGSFVHDESDLSVQSGALVFELKRYYGSSYIFGKAMGAQWRFAGDTVVLRGVQLNARVDATSLNEKRAAVLVLYNQAKTAYESVYGSLSQYQSVRDSYITKRYKVAALLPAARTTVQLAEQAELDCRNTSYHDQAYANLLEARRLVTILNTEYAVLNSAVEGIKNARDNILDIHGKWLELDGLTRSAEAIASLAESRHAANAKALSPHWPEYFEAVGNDNLCLIDESGSPVVFVPAGNGLFAAKDDPQQLRGLIRQSGTAFVHQRRDGRFYTYNADGLLVGIGDRNGSSISLERSANGQLARISAGTRSWQFGYSNGLLASISGPEGFSVSYTYDARRRLETVRDSGGHSVRYEYVDDLLVGIHKPDGSVLRYSYALQSGRTVCTVTEDEENARERFFYNFPARYSEYHDPVGGVHTFNYDDKMRYVRETHPGGYYKEYSYDNLGNLIRTVEPGWTLRYEYDSRGNRIRTLYQDGSSEAWEYDSHDLVIRHADRDGVRTWYDRDGQGNITAIRRGNLLIASYQWSGGRLGGISEQGVMRSLAYDADGFVSRVSWPDGSSDDFVNNAWGKPSRWTDRLGRVTFYEYDSEQRLRVERLPGGLERHYQYDARKDLVRVEERDSLGGQSAITSMTYDRRHLLTALTNAAGEQSSFQYRADGKLASSLVGGRWLSEYDYSPGGYLASVARAYGDGSGSERYVERYSWDSMGRLTAVEKPLGRITEYRYGSSGWQSAELDALQRLSEQTRSPGGRLSGSRGTYGDELQYYYDQAGLLEAARRPMAGYDEQRLEYDEYGRLSRRTDASGVQWSYRYDGNGRLHQTWVDGRLYRQTNYDAGGRLLELRDGEGRVMETWTYAQDGRSAERRDGLGNVTRLELDAWGRTVRLTDPEGRARRYEYDALGRVTAAFDGYDRAERYEYNALGKISRVTGRDGAPRWFEYNHLGLLTEERDAYGVVWSGSYDEAGRLRSARGRPGVEEQYSWDALDRLTERQAGGSLVERYQYDDQTASVRRSDARGAESLTLLDERGRAVAETNRSGWQSTYRYDRGGRLSETRSFGGQRSERQYDALGRLVYQLSADGSEKTWRYDSVGRLLEAHGPDGLLRYEYDAAGRLVKSHDSALNEAVEYRYDRSGLRIAMQRGGSTVQYSYGRNGELLKIDDQGLTISFSYDEAGRERSRLYANGIRIDTMYDQAGRIVALREVRVNGGLILRAYGYLYDSHGRVSHRIDERSRVTSYQYDAQGRLSAVLYPFDAGKREADLAEARRYGLVPIGQGQGQRQDFSLETASALGSVQALALGFHKGNAPNQLAWAERFSYDANGNRLTKLTAWGILHYEYGADDQLLKLGVGRFEYDRDGRLVEERDAFSLTRYVYGADNRPVEVTRLELADSTSEVVHYSYDALGRRSSRIVEGSGGYRSSYDGFGFDELRQVAVGSRGNPLPPGSSGSGAGTSGPGAGSSGTTRYRYFDEATGGLGPAPASGGSQAVPGATRNMVVADGRTLGMRSGSVAYYAGHDRLGSVETVYDTSGSLLDRYEYDAFGGLMGGTVETGLGLGYAGKPYDPLTGKYNYGFRDYAPEQARFSTVDPIRDGANWYAYCNMDPVNFLDLWGLMPKTAAERQAGQQTSHNNKSDEIVTGQIGLGVSLALGLAVSVEVGVMFDTSGDVSPYITLGGGVGFGASLKPVVGAYKWSEKSVKELSEASGSSLSAGCFLGIEQDLDTGRINGINAVIFGGQVTKTVTANKYTRMSEEVMSAVYDRWGWEYLKPNE